jgi:hypothetical protein
MFFSHLIVLTHPIRCLERKMLAFLNEVPGMQRCKTVLYATALVPLSAGSVFAQATDVRGVVDRSQNDLRRDKM